MIVKLSRNLESIKDTYMECFEKSEYNHYFQSYPVINNTDTWYYRVRWHSPVIYYMVIDEDKPVLIAGFRQDNPKSLIPIGGKEGYDFCDFVYGTDDMEKIEHAVFELLETLREKKIVSMVLKFLDENSPAYKIFCKYNLICGTAELIKNTSISIQYPDYNAYLSTLSRHVRQNLRTARNRIARDGKLYEFSFYTGRTDVDILKKVCTNYLEVYLNRQADKYKGNSFQHQLFLKKFNYITNSAINERCIMADIKIDGKVAAFLQGGLSSSKKMFEVPRLAIADKFGVYSPGMLLVDETIKFLINHMEIDEFNLCRGDEEYKYKMGGKNYNTINCVISV